jgi:hypothetical protein
MDEVDGNGWNWVGVDENGWRWVRMGGNGWEWFAASRPRSPQRRFPIAWQPLTSPALDVPLQSAPLAVCIPSPTGVCPRPPLPRLAGRHPSVGFLLPFLALLRLLSPVGVCPRAPLPHLLWAALLLLLPCEGPQGFKGLWGC